jgi:hypothetical protein
MVLLRAILSSTSLEDVAHHRRKERIYNSRSCAVRHADNALVLK